MEPKARITVRFDPPPSPNAARASRPSDKSWRLLQEEAAQPSQAVISSITPNTSPTPTTRSASGVPVPEDHPTQDDAALLEQLIRRADRPFSSEAAPYGRTEGAKAETNTAEPDKLPDRQAPLPDAGPWIEDGIEFARGARGGFRSKDEGPSWWKVFASAAGAIATGALFGYLVLTLFSGSTPFAASSAGSGANPADAAQVSPGGSGANPTLTAAAADAAGESWPGATYYWLQYGVFRSPEAMDAAVQELREAGLPGWGEDSDGYRVFAGVAADKAEAERLAAQMPRHELFIKPIRIEDTEGSADGLPFIQDSGRLAGMLSRLSVAALQDELPEPFEPDELAALRGEYGKWRASASAIEGWEGSRLQEARAMIEAFEAAMASVDQYESKVSRYHLWNVQADLMKVLSAERRLREAFAAST